MSKMKFLQVNLLKTKYEITKIKIPSIPLRVHSLNNVSTNFCFCRYPIYLILKSFSKGGSLLIIHFRKLKTRFGKLQLH